LLIHNFLQYLVTLATLLQVPNYSCYPPALSNRIIQSKPRVHQGLKAAYYLIRRRHIIACGSPSAT
jgi:hypothetical protein